MLLGAAIAFALIAACELGMWLLETVDEWITRWR